MPEPAEWRYRPDWHQWRFHRARDEGYSYRWLCAGVGSGKSFAGLAEDWILATQVCPGLSGLIVVTGFRVLRETFVPLIRQTWPRGLYELVGMNAEPKILVHTPQGDSTIYVRSSKDAGTVEDINSLTVSWAHLDEVGRSRVGQLAWRYTLGRLREPGGTGGIHVTSSPRPGWLPKEWGLKGGIPDEGKSWKGGEGYSPKKRYWAIQAASRENTHNREGFAEDLRVIYGEGAFARQELDGSIESATGLLYPEFARGFHVLPAPLAMDITSMSRHWEGGMDWGWNAAANVWGAWIEGGSTLVVTGEWYQQGCQDDEQIAAAYGHGQVGQWWADPEAPGSIEKARKGCVFHGRAVAITCKGADKPFLASVGAVRGLMHRRPGVNHPAFPGRPEVGCPRLLISDACPHLIRELEDLHSAYDPEDPRPQPDYKTTGSTDHAADALRYLVWNSDRSTEVRSTWVNV